MYACINPFKWMSSLLTDLFPSKCSLPEKHQCHSIPVATASNNNNNGKTNSNSILHRLFIPHPYPQIPLSFLKLVINIEWKNKVFILDVHYKKNPRKLRFKLSLTCSTLNSLVISPTVSHEYPGYARNK